MQCRCSADQRGSVHDLRASRAGRWAQSKMGRVLLLSPLQLGVARDDSSVQGHARGEEARDKPIRSKGELLQGRSDGLSWEVPK